MDTITVSLDNLTLGDLEALESGNFKRMLEVFEHTVSIDGVSDEQLPTELRKLNWSRLGDIGDAIRAAVDEEINPTVDGKN